MPRLILVLTLPSFPWKCWLLRKGRSPQAAPRHLALVPGSSVPLPAQLCALTHFCCQWHCLPLFPFPPDLCCFLRIGRLLWKEAVTQTKREGRVPREFSCLVSGYNGFWNSEDVADRHLLCLRWCTCVNCRAWFHVTAQMICCIAVPTLLEGPALARVQPYGRLIWEAGPRILMVKKW